MARLTKNLIRNPVMMDESVVDIPESGSHTTAYSTEDERNS